MLEGRRSDGFYFSTLLPSMITIHNYILVRSPVVWGILPLSKSQIDTFYMNVLRKTNFLQMRVPSVSSVTHWSVIIQTETNKKMRDPGIWAITATTTTTYRQKIIQWTLKEKRKKHIWSTYERSTPFSLGSCWVFFQIFSILFCLYFSLGFFQFLSVNRLSYGVKKFYIGEPMSALTNFNLKVKEILFFR